MMPATIRLLALCRKKIIKNTVIVRIVKHFVICLVQTTYMTAACVQKCEEDRT